MDLIVNNNGKAEWIGRIMDCAFGRGGLISVDKKIEGDGATPIGRWPMREVIYRADRVTMPKTILPVREMRPDDGWCEQPHDPNYNRLVKHPYPLPVDQLWREDHIYDILVVLGYNDDPIIPGKGSAIFMHLARHGYSPSAGCVTLNVDDLLTILREADKNSAVEVRG